MSPFVDIHTHQITPNVISVCNCFPQEITSFLSQNPSHFFSIGLHPWYISSDYLSNIDIIRQYSLHPQVLAIGEAGLDKFSKTDFELQMEVFKQQIEISEQSEKPLIIHSVKSFSELLQLKKTLKPEQKWIIHGFRGNKTLAKQLTESGLYLSFGKNIENMQEVVVATNMENMFLETDDRAITIGEVYRQFAMQKGVSLEFIVNQLYINFDIVFLKSKIQ
jgi:TatD DNase family protein